MYRSFFRISLLAILLSMPLHAEAVENVICDGVYALCTSAPCIPAPRDPKNKSICECVVQEGKSYGNTPCETRKPKTLADGTKMLTSTYSFEQAPVTQVMTCPAGNPWSNCLDMACTVDPLNTKRAICNCEIVREGKFVTYGGSCDTGSCGLAYWSGATVGAFTSASKFLAKELGQSGMPLRQCGKKK
jgi:hypothetical protein